MIRRPFALAAAGAVALALGLAACGGGSDSNTDFTASANEICTDYARAADEVYAQGTLSSETNPQGAAQQTRDVSTALQDKIDKLQALDPPSDVSSDYQHYLDLLNKELDLNNQAIKPLSQNDQATVARINTQAAEISAQADDAAQAAGLDTCGHVLPSEDADQVKQLLIDGFTADTVAEERKVCEEGLTDNALKAFGGLKGCSQPSGVTSLDVLPPTGIENVDAQAYILPHGGNLDNQPLFANLVYQDGRYKLDALQNVPLSAYKDAEQRDGATSSG